MKRVYAVIELADDSRFDPFRDDHLDEIAEDLLMAAHRVRAVSVYPSFGELAEGRSHRHLITNDSLVADSTRQAIIYLANPVT